nr:MAG TPA: hypothetical protein [Caudoviricetes sp.]
MKKTNPAWIFKTLTVRKDGHIQTIFISSPGFLPITVGSSFLRLGELLNVVFFT